MLEVVTADRVVGQTITEHPLDGYMPSISFLGTRFENLRIAGFPVELEFDQEIFGSKPVNDLPYTAGCGRCSAASAASTTASCKNKNLPAALQERYNQLSSTLGASEAVECSLVNQAAGLFPGTIFGNVITIPGFGTITLAKLTVKHEDPHARDEDFQEDHLHADDDRSQAGLRRRRGYSDWWRIDQWNRGIVIQRKLPNARWTITNNSILVGIREWFRSLWRGSSSRNFPSRVDAPTVTPYSSKRQQSWQCPGCV